MKNTETFIDETISLIAQSNLKEALLNIRQLLKGSPLFSEIIIHSSRYNDVMKAIRLGTIDIEDANIEKNKVRFALMDILQELSENTNNNSTLKTEVEKFLKQEISSVSNNIHIEGDDNTVIQGIKDSLINIQYRKNK
jgi:hypothetical protein